VPDTLIAHRDASRVHGLPGTSYSRPFSIRAQRGLFRPFTGAKATPVASIAPWACVARATRRALANTCRGCCPPRLGLSQKAPNPHRV